MYLVSLLFYSVCRVTKDGKTFLHCLQEVDNSRPYFVGIIGQRYGWCQEKNGQDDSLTATFEAAEKVPQYLSYCFVKCNF